MILALAEQFSPDMSRLHAEHGIYLPPDREAELDIWVHWTRNDVPRSVPRMIVLGHPLLVRVNHGRWIVDCDACGVGAAYASRTDHRFFCVHCLNLSCNGGWRMVSWPKNADEIEDVLCRRPLLETRNWKPGETVADLIAENKTFGVI